jgi:hypothetical protein
MDIQDQPLVIDDPVTVDQAVSKIEKGFQPLKQVIRNNPVIMRFYNRIDVA